MASSRRPAINSVEPLLGSIEDMLPEYEEGSDACAPLPSLFPSRSFGPYIMSGGMPPPGIGSFFSGISVTTASVVRTMAAIEAAF